MSVKIVRDKITRSELETLAQETFVSLIKGVIDVERKVIAFGGSLHADAETLLLEDGSVQKDVWGFNIVFQPGPFEECVQYASLINVRPHAGNRSMNIQLPEVRVKILEILRAMVRWET